ncbi:superinfection immunity protein [Notoacmeibacter ruber]|uniref:Superinfection immunity protein n=1 Tax=Notoacmeibacter ruber TaxID=2670375 RepID=A0A3L7JES7_9HYPH|nr:superinfection immunity protein [Notoacmeibacter ruber]RLQ89277.1 superinfection immunity protein [Notoacmeibacter ruber]
MNDGAAFMLDMMIGGVILLMIVVTPIVIAFIRRHPNRWAIFIITVVFGFTILGWLIALIWSLHGFHRSAGPLRDGGESGLNLFGNDRLSYCNYPANGASVYNSAASPRASNPVPAYALPPQRPGSNPIVLADQIERLVSLKTTGAISEQEYDRLKADVLGI